MSLHTLYSYLIDDLGDPRWKNYFLVETPWPMLFIVSFYLYFTTVWGPRFMKNREPYKIEWLITLYNIIQIAWNFHIFFYIFRIANVAKSMENFSLWCLPLSYSNEDALSLLLFEGFKSYYYNKFFDLLDTTFFVLRKKFNQISYLHVYHHAFMCAACWVATKYAPGGNTTTVGLINGPIHIIMYSYYQLALMGYTVWWKKYITQLQIIQFLIVIVHNFPLFFMTSCSYNFIMAVLVVAQAAYFVYMFSNYYLKTYLKHKKR